MPSEAIEYGIILNLMLLVFYVFNKWALLAGEIKQSVPQPLLPLLQIQIFQKQDVFYMK